MQVSTALPGAVMVWSTRSGRVTGTVSSKRRLPAMAGGDGACPGVDAAVEERSDSPHTAGDDDASRLVARGEPPGVVDRVNVDETHACGPGDERAEPAASSR